LLQFFVRYAVIDAGVQPTWQTVSDVSKTPQSYNR
jgi:hypothetical protein